MKDYIFVYIFINIINPQNFFHICWIKYLINRPIFHNFYMQSATVKPRRLKFMRNY